MIKEALDIEHVLQKQRTPPKGENDVYEIKSISCPTRICDKTHLTSTVSSLQRRIAMRHLS